MSLRNRLLNQKAMLPTTQMALPSLAQMKYIGGEISLYPADAGQKYVDKGYKLNDAIYSITSKNARKAAQVRMYHARVKREERKTLFEYTQLQKGSISEKVVKELGKMRKSMMDENIVDSPLSKLLNKPARHHTQASWIEILVLLRELQGEGNIWKSRGAGAAKPIELMPIPKQHLVLRGNVNDPWDITGYQFVLNGTVYNWSKEDVVMWKYQNPATIDNTFEHLRGLAPLEPGRVLMQAMNEGDVRVATANKNAGASGFAFNKTLQKPTPEQRDDMRRQFNDAVNSSDMANKVAILAGEWGYYNIGQTLEEMRILEQYDVGFKRLCRLFETPHGIFNDDAKYANGSQYKKDWIYDKIAPMVYGLRALLSESLLPDFGLDPERDLIDCDIMSLPEMVIDVKSKIDALSKADFLSKNEKRIATGYEPLGPEYDIVPSDDLGGNLDKEVAELGDDE